MQRERNIIPDKVNKIHLIAVCGTAMGALACMLKELGYEVTGSDQKVYPPMSDFLMEKGIALKDGFRAENLAYGPDLVVVGNAVRKENPEVLYMDSMGIPFCSMPQALNAFAARGKKALVVTGTHGKTTTSSLLAWVLFSAGLDPTFMIGGILNNFNSNYRLGKGDYIVLEGDEYDTAFFDKGAKFHHYQPFVSILTSIEFDHADIFEDLEHIKRTFGTYVVNIPDSHRLLVYDQDPHVAEVVQAAECEIRTYGFNPSSYWCITDYRISPPGINFKVAKDGKPYGAFTTPLMGEHNLVNTLAVIGVADSIGLSGGQISEALTTFQSAKRRQQIRGVKRGVTVMDDFAHHPTAVRETLKAVKPFYTPGRIIAVFEPRTNSSMRKVFQSVYPSVFDAADMVCIREPSAIDKIAPEERFSSRQLVDDLVDQGKVAHYFSDTEAIIDFIVEKAIPGDLVIVMSNGGFDNIHARLLEALGN